MRKSLMRKPLVILSALSITVLSAVVCSTLYFGFHATRAVDTNGNFSGSLLMIAMATYALHTLIGFYTNPETVPAAFRNGGRFLLVFQAGLIVVGGITFAIHLLNELGCDRTLIALMFVAALCVTGIHALIRLIIKELHQSTTSVS